MKWMGKQGKIVWVQGLACFLLLMVQTLCGLSLPALMGRLIDVGVQQGGVEAGVPEVLSGRGMELLRLYMDEENRQILDQVYLWLEPGSSEAQRVAEQYPPAREINLCVLRGDLDRETLELADRAYAQAAHGFLLGLEEARESGELSRLMQALEAEAETARKKREEAARQRQEQNQSSAAEPPESEPEESEVEFGAYLRLPSENQDFLPEGVLGAIPDNALFTLPEGFAPGQEDSETVSQPEGTQEPESAGTSAALEGLSKMSIRQFYALGALLAQTPQESREKTAAAVRDRPALIGEQTGAVLKYMFYWEMGVDMAGLRSAYLWGAGWKMLGAVLLGAAAAALSALLSARISAAVGRELRHRLYLRAESAGNPLLLDDVGQVQALLDGMPALCCAPLLGIGAAVLAAGKNLPAAGILAFLTAALPGLLALARKVFLPHREAQRQEAGRLRQIGREQLSGLTEIRIFGREEFEKERFRQADQSLEKASRRAGRSASLGAPVLLLAMDLACLAVLWTGGSAVAASTLRAGNVLAFFQYVVLIGAAFWAAAGSLARGAGAGPSAARLRAALKAQPEQAEDGDSGKEALS